MIPVLLLGLTLGYLALTVPRHQPVPPTIQQRLVSLGRAIKPSPAGLARLDQVVMIQGSVSQTHDKKLIHLCLSQGSTTFDLNTVMLAGIHELAHVLCDQEGHGLEFRRIEQQMIAEARQRGYLTTDQMDPNYPCLI